MAFELEVALRWWFDLVSFNRGESEVKLWSENNEAGFASELSGRGTKAL